jgi:hypothetical protein
MDVLAKEAVVPTETLSSLGTRGRKGREVVYPQDRFVLVNAGDDLSDFLNAEFERKEVVDTQVDKNYRDLGVTGEAIWAQRGGREFAKGITCIDVYTQYYRLRDNPLKTIFVIPAHEIHPGVQVTREIEQQPTVVSVVKPVWPERMSVLETKHKSEQALLNRLQYEARDKDKQIDLAKQSKDFSEFEITKLKGEKQMLEKKVEELLDMLKQHPNQSKLRNFEELGRASAARMEAAEMRAQYEKLIADHKNQTEYSLEQAKEMQAERERFDKALAAKETEKKKEWAKKERELNEWDRDVARSAENLNAEIKKAWLRQFMESQVMIEFLRSPELQRILADEKIPEDVRKVGEAIGKSLHDAATSHLPNRAPKPGPIDANSSEEEDSSGDGRGSGGGVNTRNPPGLDNASLNPSWRQSKEPSSAGSRRNPSPTLPSPRRSKPKNVHWTAPEQLSKSSSGGEGSASSTRTYAGDEAASPRPAGAGTLSRNSPTNVGFDTELAGRLVGRQTPARGVRTVQYSDVHGAEEEEEPPRKKQRPTQGAGSAGADACAAGEGEVGDEGDEG